VAPIAIVFGVLLSILGIVLFGLADPDRPRGTALIPTGFGSALIILGVVSRNEKARKHAMHGAALLALIGFLIPAYRAIRDLLGEAPVNHLAISGQLIMAVLCAVFLVLCVKSFIAARRARQAKEAAKH
jgi:hypothetical protein